ncbi:hypothetical protein B296_00003751 [Ensete ventricosum]|uniref:Complex III subunit 9 n=1 Tax=Ensete ventricosum TaxID=4639 RepID=A0A427AE82_ENSVE|nr:hypothetical protein B296_00003751 [Ensete ventricosum]
MDSTAATRGRGGGVWEGLYHLLMRRNSVYVTFVVAGALVHLCLGVIFLDTLGFDMLDRDCSSEQSQPSFALTTFV